MFGFIIVLLIVFISIYFVRFLLKTLGIPDEPITAAENDKQSAAQILPTKPVKIKIRTVVPVTDAEAVNDLIRQSEKIDYRKGKTARPAEPINKQTTTAPAPVKKNPNRYSAPPARGNNDLTAITEQIKALKELLDSGAITQEEFDKLKKQYLNL